MKIFSISLLAALAVVSSAAADTSLRPNDFAFGIPLQTDGQSPVYEAQIPADVYKGAFRGDLGDLRVFNAEGNAVPYVIAPGGSTEEELSSTMGLSVYPIREGVNQSADSLSVMIRQGSEEGSEVNLKTEGAQTEKKRIVAYLLAATDVSGPMRSLTLSWSGQEGSFLLPATLEASDDLKTWRTVVDDGLIAQLSVKESAGVSRKDKLEFEPVKAHYLRLKFRDAERIAPNLSLDTAYVSYVTGTKSADRSWSTVKGTPSGPKTYVFDLGAPLPVDRIELLLPEGNHAVDCEISSNNKADEPKTWQFSGLIYRLTQAGHELTSGTIAPSAGYERTPQRYWYLDVKDDSSGFGSDAPSLKAGWVPSKVVFVAEGKGPYLLAYGSAVIRKARFDENALLKIQEGSGLQRGTAAAGKMETLGGPGRLTLPPPAPPSMKEIWGKRAALAGMVLATALLAWMAYRLARQMAAGKGTD